MKTYRIQTFGCQMNYSDSERVMSLLEGCGFRPVQTSEIPNLVVVNTCSVRQKSEDKAIGYMRNQKEEHPSSIIAVTGCMVRQTGDRQTSKDELLHHKFIDLVFRIEDTARLPKILETHFPDHDFSEFEQSFGAGSLENYFHILPKVKNRYQVYVPIMQGCDKYCAYCIVPYTRGREISRPMDEILTECETFVANGAKEIWLLGQNVNSYQHERKKCFATLLQKIDHLHEKGLSRLRFTSPHPQDFSDDVIQILATMKTSCPYVHLPAQHGSDYMLRAMNRNYTVAQYETIVRKLRKAIPNIVIATDIIVGFPGETEEDVQELCDFARRVRFDFSYTAIFSPRKNTPAAEMTKDFIPEDIKRERFHLFDQVIKETAWARRESEIGRVLEVLVESSVRQKNGLYRNMGRSREFFEVYFDSLRPYVGKEVDVKITDRDRYILNAELENEDQRAGLRMM